MLSKQSCLHISRKCVRNKKLQWWGSRMNSCKFRYIFIYSPLLPVTKTWWLDIVGMAPSDFEREVIWLAHIIIMHRMGSLLIYFLDCQICSHHWQEGNSMNVSSQGMSNGAMFSPYLHCTVPSYTGSPGIVLGLPSPQHPCNRVSRYTGVTSAVSRLTWD